VPAEPVRGTGVVEQALATGRAAAERIGLEAGTSRAGVAETGMRSEEAPGVPRATTDLVRAPAAAAVPQAWALEAVVVVVAGVEGGAGKRPKSGEMKIMGARI
jgi:hypothetical protein